MKKLSLEMLRLTSDEVLGRSQMKKVTGGYESSNPCANIVCQNPIFYYCVDGECLLR